MATGYVIPQGIIRFYKNVPLSPTYNDVLYAKSGEEIYGKIGRYEDTNLRCTQETYTRVNNESKIRVGINAEYLYTCNYMSWQNSGFGKAGMMFFAFIVNVEYINNNCTEITYLIDDMSTWFPYCELKQCYVERETPVSDELYEHLEPEDVAIGDYVENGVTDDLNLGDTKVLFMAATDSEGNRPEPVPGEDDPYDTSYSWVNGVKSALYYIIYDCKSREDMRKLYDILSHYNNNGQAENIIAIMLIPEFLTERMRVTSFGTAYASKEWEIVQNNNIDGYIPRNKKLFSFPFSKLTISNKSGGTRDYKYENFSTKNGTARFNVTGCAFGTPTVMVEPEMYINHIGGDPDQSIVLTNFAQAPCFNDTYRAYLAQNKNSLTSQAAFGVLSSLITITAGAALAVGSGGTAALVAGLGAMGGGVVGLGSSLAKPAAANSDAKNLPVHISGLVQADAINAVRNITGFEGKKMSIKREYAEMIDSYFSAFGYACNKVKTPNISGRKVWNYTKTQGSCVVGNAPATALKNINDIFDHGVRFWYDPNDIGNYTKNN